MTDALPQPRPRQPQRIPRLEEDALAPLSFAQERLWFLDQLDPGTPTYNMPLMLTLRHIDAAALSRSMNALIERHEALRTTIGLVDGQLVQRITSRLEIPLPMLSSDAVDAEARHVEALAQATEVARRPFDLARGPLIRTRLYDLGEGRALLLIVLHHIIADAWSLSTLARDLGELYHAETSGMPAAVAALPVRYVDFAAWQRTTLEDGRRSTAMRYWLDHLADLPPVLDLPVDRPRGASSSAAGDVVPFAISKNLADQLWRIAADEQATVFMAALTVFVLQLRRYADQTDIAVGTPIASRDRSEIEHVVGLFLNTLVLRIRLEDGLSFRETLRRVRDVCVAGYAHQDVPFEYLVEALKPDRNLGANPLFQILFVFQGGGRGRAASGDGEGERGVEIATGTAKFDLSLYLTDSGAGLEGVWEYRTAIFDRGTIERMSGHFVNLLAQVLETPDRPCSELVMPVPEECDRLVRFNTSAVPRDPRCPHQLFEASARRLPDEIALLLDGETIGYADLDRRANRLARGLRRLGVTRGAPVGICVERSFEMVVGLLAILKAGGVHVPLDPAFPVDRLAFMASDVGLDVLLTQESLLQRLPAGLAATVFRLDTDWPALAEDADMALDDEPGPDDLVYILYTSGSTGRPKGTGLRHSTLTSLIHWQNRIAPTRPGARTLQFMSFSFDVSFIEILATLAAGGTVVLCREDDRRDMATLRRLMIDTRIERAFLPFAALQQLAHHALAAGHGGFALADVVSTGERLVVTEDIRAFFAGLGGCRLHNAYGPTETHWVTWETLAGAPADWPALPPIGRAVDNAVVLLLDSMLQPVPVGVAGDLYAGGLAIARGYEKRPALTAERFLPDAWSTTPGARMYRTGDRARMRPDGTIEYLGRNDDQIKIRGFRVELGEIEAALSEHPDVAEGVVQPRGSGSDLQLVGYVRPRAGATVAANALRAFLGRHLPGHMLPAQFVSLEAFPLGATGKVDRRRLPDPGIARPDPQRAFRAPENEIEALLQEIWGQVLGLAVIGVEDDFFELGGHSLTAMQVITRVRTAFDLDVPVRVLFERPTIAQMAVAVVEQQLAALSDEEADALLREFDSLGQNDPPGAAPTSLSHSEP